MGADEFVAAIDSFRLIWADQESRTSEYGAEIYYVFDDRDRRPHQGVREEDFVTWSALSSIRSPSGGGSDGAST